MFLRQITDPSLAQNAYLIGCQRSGEAIIVDPERDLDRYFAVAAEQGLKITAVAETHIHADYLSGAREMVERHGAIAYLSAEGGADWQFEWAQGDPRARLLRDGEVFKVGNIEFRAILTAGHTPEHLSFLVTDLGGGADEPIALLSGDFLFVGDVGRPDLLESAAGQAGAMEPSARTLYESLRRTEILPEHLQILPAHGAGSACGKALGAVPTSVLGYERRFNGALREALEGRRDEFVRDILSGQPEPPLYFARMKRDNRSGPALLPEGRLPSPRRIVAAELAEWVGVPGRAVLDLRGDRVAFDARHVRGSIFAPLAGGKLPISAGSYLDEKTALLLVLEDEAQLDEAVRQLVRIGLDEVVGWISAAEALVADEWVGAMPRISTAELAAVMVDDAAALLLDVRGADEFAASHVDGAVNIAYTRLAARLGELPGHRRVRVHCASGLRAAMAASFLSSRGFEVVHVDGDYGAIAHRASSAHPSA
ncbi:MAG: MBL fold metallo-hydrolase [Verrucomicrobia bacterium]|nr:MAG: MBL fold metallo-hydrolase [Verrucomicrobiota bacterium]TAE87343.1 MAG: MBL fold metallo-hydrolase [Verrucomicrobiota bacterium]TAF25198.1 MAG: MBL fold metallo-hydrolase [Verrucomicrobiota bacterium]TAF40843.1 MAG: MBL fold metallo-hydrolase [Verrucomicrobiota bacterium]